MSRILIIGMSTQVKSFLAKAVDNLDTTLALLGCILAIPLTLYLYSVFSANSATAGVIVFLACFAYLIFRRRASAVIRAQTEAMPRLHLLLGIVFFCLLTYSILALHLRPDPYTRPLGYFFGTAAMAAVLAVEILLLPSRKSATYFALFKIMVIGFSLAWSHSLLYPSVVGADSWYHQGLTLRMLDVGHIPSGSVYSHLPVMHLASGVTSLITGLDYKMATMFSVSLLQVVCNILFVFLLGKFMHSTRAGLLAALLLSVAHLHVRFAAYYTIPNSVGVVLIPIVVYLLFKLRQESPRASICLSALFMAVLLLTHAIAAVMLAMLLLFIWLGFQAYKRLRYPAAAGARIFLVALVLFGGATLSYWTFVSGHIGTLTRLAETGFSVEFYGTAPPRMVEPPPDVVAPPPEELPPLPIAVAQYRDHVVPYSEHLLNSLGPRLFFAFAFIGGLAMLSRGLRNRYAFAFVIAAFLILAVNYSGVVASRGFITCRWDYLLQILLAIPVGIAFLSVAGLPGRRVGSACLIGMMVFALAFLMVMTPLANNDNRVFAPNLIVRHGFARSELQAMHTAINIYDGRIAGDRNYRDLARLPELEGRIVNICDQLYSREFTLSQDMFVLIREEITANPFKISSYAPFRLEYVPGQALLAQGFSRVYASGWVSGFTK